QPAVPLPAVSVFDSEGWTEASFTVNFSSYSRRCGMVLANGPSVGRIDCLPDGLVRPLVEFELAWANARVVAVQQRLCGVFPASWDGCRLFVFVVGISVFDGGNRLARSSTARKGAVLC